MKGKFHGLGEALEYTGGFIERRRRIASASRSACR